MRFVYETLIEMNAFELSQLFRVERADAQVADGLSGATLSFCPFRFQDLDHLMSQ